MLLNHYIHNSDKSKNYLSLLWQLFMTRIVFKKYYFFAITLILYSCDTHVGENGTVLDVFKPAVVDFSALEKNIEQIKSDTFNFSKFFVEQDSLITNKEMSALYPNNESLWLDKFGLNQKAEDFLAYLRQCDNEGFIPAQFEITTLDSLKKLLNKEKLSTDAQALLEMKISYAYLKLSRQLLHGRILPNSIDKTWNNTNDSTANVLNFYKLISENTVQNVLDSLRPNHPWYKRFLKRAEQLSKVSNVDLNWKALQRTWLIGDSSEHLPALRKLLNEYSSEPQDINSSLWQSDIEDAIVSFQKDFGLERTGKLDSATIKNLKENPKTKLKKLCMNMERMRWLKKEFNKEFIWVNIPQMELFYYEKDSLSFYMRTVVGKLSRKTPTLDSKLSNIVFNPPWYVPPTILKQEVIPGIQRRGGSYLARRGLVARDSRGRIVRASAINGSNYKRFSISQNPGRNSALGSVKFNFPNKDAIFLHDTNHRGDFGNKYRALSSGCIRLHHPKNFAEFVLRDTAYSANNIDTIIKKGKTQSVNIKRDIGVHIVYLTMGLDSAGSLIPVPDLYKWDEKLEQLF